MEEFTGQIGMCLVDADAIPTPGDVSVHRQNLSVLANRYFGEFRNRIPCIERNGNKSSKGWSPTELKEGLVESVGCRQGEGTRPLDDVQSKSPALSFHSFGSTWSSAKFVI